jgi:hypothetical protein
MLSTTVLLTASMIAGQAHGEKAIDPNLKPLTPLVGSWDVEFDWPDLPVEKAKVTYSWVLHGKYLEARWRAIDGEFLGSEYFAWDPTEKEIRLWGFDPWSFSKATWQISGDRWTGTYTSTRFDGTGSKNTITLVFKGSNTVHVTRTPKGSEQPDGTATFVRVTPKSDQDAASAAANRYLRIWKEYFQGDWDTKLVEGEDREGRLKVGATGTWSCKLSPTEVCMLFQATANGSPDSSTVAGYDPKSDAWKEVSFMADGSHLTQFYFATLKELAGDPVGKEIKGVAEFVYPDGRVESGKIGVQLISRDKFKYYAVNRKLDGTSQPDLVLIMQRK